MGIRGTKTHNSWRAMRARCDSEENKDYHLYGGRVVNKIQYPGKWARYSGFLADMGERPIGTELDRIDNDKNYSKENCRWTTHEENSRHTRHCKLTPEKVRWIKAILRCTRSGITAAAANERIATVFKVSASTIQAIRTSRAWYNIQ